MTWLQLIFAALFALLSVDAFFVLKHVRAAVSTFVDFQTKIYEAQLQSATLQNETFTKLGNTLVTTSTVLVKHHHDTLQSLALTHETGMAAVRETHEASAEQLRLAASASADSTVELRRAAEVLGVLVKDSNLLSINGHLFALRKFFVGQNEQ